MHDTAALQPPHGREHLTTDAVDPADRLEYWREIVCSVFLELKVTSPSITSFAGSVDVTSWGQARITRVATQGQTVTRKLPDARSDCLVSLQLTGTGYVTQSGRTAKLGPGDLALYDSIRPYRLDFGAPFQQLVLQFPRQELIARGIDIPGAVARRCSGGEGRGAVAAQFLRTLATHSDELIDPHRDHLGTQAIGHVAVTLADLRGDAVEAQTALAFHRRRALQYVQRNLDDPGLSVSRVAEALGLSVRTIQQAFAEDDTQLSTTILQARLSRARAALLDPAQVGHTITRIAHGCGFLSASHFSRVFKSEYGHTPGEFRLRI